MSIYTSKGRAWQSLNTQAKLDRVNTQRTLSRFAGKYTVEPTTGCWNWTAGTHRERGYALFWYGGFTMFAHRASWMIHHGPIPADMHVLHKCDNRLCVNPEHLFLGTNEDNYKDRDAKLRMPHGVRCATNKLSPDDIRDILASTKRNAELARQYGVDPSHIMRIRRGERWKHLDRASAVPTARV